MRDIVKQSGMPSLELDSELTMGDVYEQMSKMVGGPEAARFFSKKLKIEGFFAPAMEGGEGRLELVLFGDELLRDTKFERVKVCDFHALEGDPVLKPGAGNGGDEDVNLQYQYRR